mmetsp:Transcript_122046/g.379925  ORF Transcript_122046/g.379925 Transcript_122046/m.379925 type:complete len:252 (+) Transcript_122046:1106-1861(+)
MIQGSCFQDHGVRHHLKEAPRLELHHPQLRINRPGRLSHGALGLPGGASRVHDAPALSVVRRERGDRRGLIDQGCKCQSPINRSVHADPSLHLVGLRPHGSNIPGKLGPEKHDVRITIIHDVGDLVRDQVPVHWRESESQNGDDLLTDGPVHGVLSVDRRSENALRQAPRQGVGDAVALHCHFAPCEDAGAIRRHAVDAVLRRRRRGARRRHLGAASLLGAEGPRRGRERKGQRRADGLWDPLIPKWAAPP